MELELESAESQWRLLFQQPLHLVEHLFACGVGAFVQTVINVTLSRGIRRELVRLPNQQAAIPASESSTKVVVVTDPAKCQPVSTSDEEALLVAFFFSRSSSPRHH